MKHKTRVMIVDDSALIRKTLTMLLETDKDIEVVHAAKDPFDARDALINKQPDVITLDIEMPKMDGLSFLKKYMRVMPTPTIIISSLAEKGKSITIEALEAGAVDFITKSKFGTINHLESIAEDIILRVKAAAQSNLRAKNTSIHTHDIPVSKRPNQEPIRHAHLTGNPRATYLSNSDKIIGIGASTGGVEHLAHIIPMFPSTSPGIVICQHMPEGFTSTFAKRLDNLAQIRVKEAEDGDRIEAGLALLAPGGKRHMKIKCVSGQYQIVLFEGEKVSFNRPSVDVLFDSIATCAGRNSACVLMTGMGRDGAQGLLHCRESGGKTFIEHERSCVVFGMPGEAQRIGASQEALNLEQIPHKLLNALNQHH